jgi:hypothetical protein
MPRDVKDVQRLTEQAPDWAVDQPMATKAHNGPRFATEVDTPSIHVPSPETAPRRQPKAKSVERRSTVTMDPLPLDADMAARVIAWVIEREAIRKRKESGQPWPWTDDPILRVGYFCNVHRENDAATRRLSFGLVQPYRDMDDLWFAVTLARCINEPATWGEIEKWLPFEPDYLRGLLEARQARGERVFRTQAYKPPTPPDKGTSTVTFLINDVLGPLWEARESLRPQIGETLMAYSDRLRECYRIGPFLAGQVIADLKHVEPLRNASDWWTFAVPGPGSERGLNRICRRDVKAAWPEPQWLATLLKLRDETAPAFAAAGIAVLDAQNMQNVLCEFDKYERARDSGGEPSRKYKSAELQPKVKPQRRAKAATVSGVLRASEAPDTACITIAVSPPLAPEPEATAHEPHCLAAALAYAAKGWRIFPAPRGEKKSHKSGAKHGGVRWGATNDPEQIKRDFAKWPDANIGLPTGADNGFWVLEVDTAKGHPKLGEIDGLASLLTLTEQHGDLPPTRQAESPSGSRHYYFKCPPDIVVHNSASEVAPGIDVRGEGGMVIAPPSEKPGVGAYRWIYEDPIADAPDWLLALVAFSGGADEGAHTSNPEPQIPLPLIKAALGAIPIKGMNYTRWIKTGLAVAAASGCSDEGFALFDAWTQGAPEYNAAGLAKKWRSFHPHSIGYASLEYWATEADPTWLNRYDAQLEAQLWRANREAAGSRDNGDTGNDREQTASNTKAKGDDQTASAKSDASEFGECDAGELLGNALPPPRQWLTLGQFCRSFLSGLVAPGDVGKTTLRLTQAVELATGRELLGMRLFGRRRVLIVSFEDDLAELHRRLLAICIHHGINPAELKGWLFCRALNGGPKLAELDAQGRRRRAGLLDKLLRQAIAHRHYDLLILDPFVKLHALNESDNPDMDFVCSLLIKIAQDCGIAVDSPAHTHKGAIQAGDADARRGASAQRDAGRLDYTFTVMSEDEAKRFGIPIDERKRYMRLDKAKANIVRAVKARWFQLVSVPLGNTTAEYPEGDNVQAIEKWEPPATWGGISAEALNAILDEMEVEMPDGRRYSGQPQAKDRAAWRAVQKYCPTKSEAQCREIIREWIASGVLHEKKYHDPVSRKEEWGLFVDPNKRPRY